MFTLFVDWFVGVGCAVLIVMVVCLWCVVFCCLWCCLLAFVDLVNSVVFVISFDIVWINWLQCFGGFAVVGLRLFWWSCCSVDGVVLTFVWFALCVCGFTVVVFGSFGLWLADLLFDLILCLRWLVDGCYR